MGMRRALSGISVVQLGDGIAPGYCGKLFADLGADLVKVEHPGGGELRDTDGLVLHLDTNKRNIALNPADESDRQLVERLVARAELVIEAPEHGVLADWGIGWDDLHDRHPQVS